MHKMMLTSTALMLSSLILSPLCLSEPVESHPQQPGGITFFIPTEDSTEILPVLHIESHVDIKINGTVALANLTQTFQNTSQYLANARYTFPLPKNATIDSIKINHQLITENSKELFLNRENPSIYRQLITHIEPNGKTTITLSYLDTVTYKNNQFHFDFPIPLMSMSNKGETNREKTNDLILMGDNKYEMAVIGQYNEEIQSTDMDDIIYPPMFEY